MRIDGENKVVYVDEPLFDELTKLKEGIGIVGIVSLFQILWEHQNNYPEIQKFLWSHEKDIWTNGEEPFLENDKDNQILLVQIWSGEYQLKIEQPQKYYWRKKKEYLASFEKLEEQFLNIDCIDDRLFLSTADKEWQEVSTIKCVFTSQEARDLLKDDFDKFEKVGCE